VALATLFIESVKNMFRIIVSCCVILCLTACDFSQSDDFSQVDDTAQVSRLAIEQNAFSSDVLNNPTAYIPPQCYTKTVAEDGAIHNPCYVCHTVSKAPNFLNDTDVQQELFFPEPGVINRWSNMFKDNSSKIAKISDETILKYVREDNYKNNQGGLILADKLQALPVEWDRNKNGQWDGFIPDSYYNFNRKGFDVAPDGKLTGWRVFAYYPFLGTFMPVNGSTDDVMIRLPELFRKDEKGLFNERVYELNLSIIESLVKQQDIHIEEVDEVLYQVDLNKDGKLSRTDTIRFAWSPNDNVTMSYVGLAKAKLVDKEINLAAGLYPIGTEFLHSVRYIDAKEGKTVMASRMKELRYARKDNWRNYYQLENIANKEVKERHDFPDRTKQVLGNMEVGLSVPQGWTYQGFIEDKQGNLRPQSYEESYFCVGCHSGIGATADTTFSFSRKFDNDSFKQGWYSWLEKDLSKIADPKRNDGLGEYGYYLTHNPSGNEYRNTEAVKNKFYDKQGNKNTVAFNDLKTDISSLLMPEVEHALIMNKAYKVIVDEQSYSQGRDGHVSEIINLHKEVELGQDTGIVDVLEFH
jgi:hypothetical protein